jgi:hypothetical protein
VGFDARKDLSVCGLLLVCTLAVFGPVLGFDFVAFDDDIYVFENLRVRTGLWPGNVAWAFSPQIGHWHPLTWLSYMLDVELFGVDPRAHHGTSLLLHACNGMLLYAGLRALTGSRVRSAAVALLFAIHPLHVEPVAWIASRKDVLSGSFFLLTLLAYASFVRRGGATRYGMLMGAFALGLMSKPMLATLPCVLLLLDCWPLARVDPQRIAHSGWLLVREKLPLFALSVASSLMTVLAADRGGALRVIEVDDRVANAVIGYAAYLSKTIWPVHLLPFYPNLGANVPASQLLGAVGWLVGGTAAAIVGWRRMPYLAVGWLWFLGMLLPVSGVVSFGGHGYADRYTYLPLIGLFIAAVWGVADLAARSRVVRAAVVGLGAVALGVLLVVARAQVGHWQTSETLFEHAVRSAPDNTLMHYKLGRVYSRQGRLEEAAGEYLRALELAPRYIQPRNSLGLIWLRQGRLDEAISSFREVLRVAPDDAPAHLNLGIALERLGRDDEAARHRQRAIEIDPGLARQSLSTDAAEPPSPAR